MATPTETEIRTQLQLVTDFLFESIQFGENNAKNIVDLQDAIDQAQEGDFAAELGSATAAARARFSTFLGGDTAMLLPVLRTYGQFFNSTRSDLVGLVEDLYDHFIATAQTVESRGLSLTQPVAGGGNVGNGIIPRLTVDENNFVFESGKPDAKQAEAVSDANSGAQIHEEVLLFQGNTASRDLLELDNGSGLDLRVTAQTHRNVGTLVNAGWESVTSAVTVAVGAPQALTAPPTGWDVTTGATDGSDLIAQADNIARALQGVSLPIALQFPVTTNVTLRQRLLPNGVVLDANVPWLCGVFMRPTLALTAGTATLSLGSTSIAQDLAVLTGDVYTFVHIALGSGSWFDNFNGTDLEVSLATTGVTTDTVSFDEVILAPGTFFDGSYYWLIGGTVAWLRNGIFTWTDTVASVGKIQEIIARATGRNLPHSGTPTLADPV